MKYNNTTKQTMKKQRNIMKIRQKAEKTLKKQKNLFYLVRFRFFEPDQRKTVKNSEKNNENKNEKQ